MLLAWKKHPVVITAGYIIGFPNDTRESILHDVDVIKRELPIDLIYFTNLTPLPGCEDHQRMSRDGAWMDPDLNKYDLNHRVTHHPENVGRGMGQGLRRGLAPLLFVRPHGDDLQAAWGRLRSNKRFDDPAPAALVSRLPPALSLPPARGRPRPHEIPHATAAAA